MRGVKSSLRSQGFGGSLGLGLGLMSACWLLVSSTLTPAGSTFTMVYNAVISLEILLISEQDDAALWRMFASALLP